MKNNLYWFIGFALLLGISRIIPHPPNFTPILAVGIFVPLLTGDWKSALPITLEIVHADTTVTHVAHKLKIFPNETVDLVSQNKIYLLNGDALKVKADRASAFTVTVSLLDQAI